MAVPSTSSGITAAELSFPWLKRILNDCETEGKFEAKWPIILLDDLSRKKLWSSCSELRVAVDGIPGQACRLLEKFMARYIRQNTDLAADPDAWITFKQMLTNRFMLLMVTCIRLAAKMASNTIHLNGDTIATFLEKKSLFFSKAQIFSVELEVFEMLSGIVPVWTNVEVGQMLANKILQMSTVSLTGVGALVNVCELYRTDISRDFMWINKTPGASIRTLHLTAAAVVVSSHYLFRDDPAVRIDHTMKIAKYISIQPSYLKTLVNIIIIFLKTFIPNIDTPPAKKVRTE